MNWKTFGLIIATFLTFTQKEIYGKEEDFCEICEEETCHSQWEVIVDYLLWKPCVNDLEFAAKHAGTTSNTFHIHSIDPKWESGVRVSFIRPEFYSVWDFIGTYTYMGCQQTSKIHSDGNIVPVISHPALSQTPFANEGKGKWRAEYQEWETLLGYDILNNEYYRVKTLFGVAGMYVNQSLKAEIIDEPDFSYTKWKSDFCGAGLRLGADCTYRLSENLEFLVSGNGSLLAGSGKSKNVQKASNDVNTPDLIIKDNDPCKIVSGYQIEACLLYETSLLNFDSVFKIGYDFMQWYNVPTHRIFVSDLNATNGNVAISTSLHSKTFGFHGLVLGLQMKF